MDLFQYISGFSSGHAALATVFVILLICGLGLPFPEEVLLIAAGYLVYDGSVSLTSAIVVCMAGVLIGDLILFTIGNRMGLTVFEHRWFKRVINRKRLRLSRKYFARHGKRIVFLARFMAGLRAPVFLSAAILRMRISTFLLIDTLAALVSVPVSVFLAYHFGAEIDQLLKFLRNAKIAVTIVVAILILALVGYFFFKKRARKLAADSASPANPTDLS